MFMRSSIILWGICKVFELEDYFFKPRIEKVLTINIKYQKIIIHFDNRLLQKRSTFKIYKCTMFLSYIIFYDFFLSY